MKTLLFSTFLFTLCATIQAQKTYTAEEYGISFATTEDFEYYELKDFNSLLNGPGYENDNYAVDIEVFPLSEIKNKFTTNLQLYAKTTAKELQVDFRENGTSVPEIGNSHYVLAYDQVDDAHVYVIVIINTQKKLAYEITVYCYTSNKSVGESIVNSFKLLD